MKDYEAVSPGEGGWGVIRIVRTLGGGVAVQQKACWLVLGELGRFICKRTYAINFFCMFFTK